MLLHLLPHLNSSGFCSKNFVTKKMCGHVKRWKRESWFVKDKAHKMLVILFPCLNASKNKPYFHFLWNVSSHMIALLYSIFSKKLVGFLGIDTCLLLIKTKWSFWKPLGPLRQTRFWKVRHHIEILLVVPTWFLKLRA